MSRWVRHILGVEELMLSDAQWARCRRRIGELSRADRWPAILVMIPGLAAMGLVPLWVRLATRASLPWRFAFELTFAVCALTYVYWLVRRRYRRHGWRALRELGYADVCARCGYDLSRHSDADGRCPECGEQFSQFHPDRTWSTGRP